MESLLVVETHPIQYHAPVYRALQQQFGIPVTAIYGSDFSVAGYFDKEFGKSFAWDTDLLSGHTSYFLSKVLEGGADSVERVPARGLGKKLREIKPKAVLIVGYASRFYQWAIFQALKQNFPILFRAETTDHALQRGPAKKWMRDQALRLFYEKCARLLYIGKRSYQHFRRLQCPEEKLIFSPYCVDTTPFQYSESDRNRLRPLARRELSIRENQTVLLFSGKLSPRKGPDLFLQAVKKLPSSVREKIALLFMGEGELKRELELSARQSSIQAYFVGFQNQTALSRYYHTADLLVMPSRHSEVWGLVVNEALHHGLPGVVSEAVGCAMDLIEQGVTGEIFKTGSTENFSLAIQRAWPLIGRPEVRENCRKKVEGYTIENAAEGIAKAYYEIMAIHAG